jgi:hypothetical protein
VYTYEKIDKKICIAAVFCWQKNTSLLLAAAQQIYKMPAAAAKLCC